MKKKPEEKTDEKMRKIDPGGEITQKVRGLPQRKKPKKVCLKN